MSSEAPTTDPPPEPPANGAAKTEIKTETKTETPTEAAAEGTEKTPDTTEPPTKSEPVAEVAAETTKPDSAVIKEEDSKEEETETKTPAETAPATESTPAEATPAETASAEATQAESNPTEDSSSPVDILPVGASIPTVGAAGAEDETGGIITPHDHDVLSGRGNSVNHHPGNEYFRSLVRHHKLAYVRCPKPQKEQFSKLIVSTVRDREPPGRFLKQNPTTKLWYNIGTQKALDKTRQALREGAPATVAGLMLSQGLTPSAAAAAGLTPSQAVSTLAAVPGEPEMIASNGGPAGGPATKLLTQNTLTRQNTQTID